MVSAGALTTGRPFRGLGPVPAPPSSPAVERRTQQKGHRRSRRERVAVLIPCSLPFAGMTRIRFEGSVVVNHTLSARALPQPSSLGEWYGEGRGVKAGLTLGLTPAASEDCRTAMGVRASGRPPANWRETLTGRVMTECQKGA